ncbi:MAG: DUF2066 domain-containing protein [Micavibrio sp.]|nr:DUF2066 domain-containing protein [Micavibrio sp.]
MTRMSRPALFSVILLLSLVSGAAFAEIGPKNGDTWTPVLPTKREAKLDDPLVVGDVVVDKTAENSVVARDQAIADARKAAFQKLAERNLTPDALKTFKMPSDNDIGMMVQDFEIKNEQMSATRYVGNFTVRFRDVVRNYMPIHAIVPPVAPAVAGTTPVLTPPATAADAKPADAAVAATPLPDNAVAGTVTTTTTTTTTLAPPVDTSAQVAPTVADAKPVVTSEADTAPVGNNILVLPYFENMAGDTLLWEETNPWLLMWQGALPKSASMNRQITVPLGDISDVAAGASNAVWSGDYKPVERLRSNYAADQVILAVANKSGTTMTVDLYSYRDGRLRRKATLTPFIGDMPDTVAFKKGMYDVLAYLQQPGRVAAKAGRPVESIAHDVTTRMPAAITAANDDSMGTTIIDSSSTSVTSETTVHRPPLVMSPTAVDTATAARMPQPRVGMAPIYNMSDMTATPATNAAAATPAAATSAVASGAGSGATQVAAQMQFEDPRSWIDLQKRLSAVYPPVRVNVTSVNSNSVAFTLSSDNPLDSVRQSLGARGITLGAAGPGAVYDVQLNSAARP